MLAIVLAAVLGVTVLVLGLQLVQAHLSDVESLDVLHSRADAAAATVRGTAAHVRVLDGPRDSLDQNMWIFDGAGDLVDGREPAGALAATVTALGTARAPTSRVVAGDYRLYARPVRGRDGTGAIATVVAGIDLAPYESAERRGLWLSLALGLVVVATAGAAASASARSALRQVRVMAQRADDWREHDLTRRFDLVPPRNELADLGGTLNRMLDRITRAIEGERRLTDEVAHELRTPLSVIRSEAQLALMAAEVPPDRAESLRAILEQTRRMEESIATMLAVARSAHSGEDTCRAADVLDELEERARGGTSVTVDAAVDGSVVIAAPAQVVVAALSPIVDNAARHARSRVRLSAEVRGARVVLTVADDGEGVQDEHREAIFDPGHTSTADGAGLGLALARRLANTVGAEVRVPDAAHGLFEVDLPGA